MENKQLLINKLENARKHLVGNKYKHFKGNIYEVKEIAVDSDTMGLVVVYQNCEKPELIWTRTLEEFTSPVDKEKYPDIEQTRRFERL